MGELEITVVSTSVLSWAVQVSFGWTLGCIRRKELLPSSVLKEQAPHEAGVCVEACELGGQSCVLNWKNACPWYSGRMQERKEFDSFWPCFLVDLAPYGVRLSVWSLRSSSLGLLTYFGHFCSCQSIHVEPCFLTQWLILQPGIQNLKH